MDLCTERQNRCVILNLFLNGMGSDICEVMEVILHT